jgi:hypothetical protein
MVNAPRHKDIRRGHYTQPMPSPMLMYGMMVEAKGWSTVGVVYDNGPWQMMLALNDWTPREVRQALQQTWSYARKERSQAAIMEAWQYTADIIATG